MASYSSIESTIFYHFIWTRLSRIWLTFDDWFLGYEVSKVEMGNVDRLAESYPQSEQLIKRLGPVKIPVAETDNSDSDYWL